MVVSVFFVVFPIGLLRRLLCPILDPLVFVPNTFCKYNLFYMWPYPQPWCTHMFWFKLKPWFEQKPCFCIETVFYTKRCFTPKPRYTILQCRLRLAEYLFPGGRRNTPKAVKYMFCLSDRQVISSWSFFAIASRSKYISTASSFFLGFVSVSVPVKSIKNKMFWNKITNCQMHSNTIGAADSTQFSYSTFIETTSSTAQAGAGSFKNRKPIGEVGCCESQISERNHWWTERWLRSPLFSLFLSLSLSFSLFLWLSTSLPTYITVYLSIYLSIYLSLSLSLTHLITVSIYLFTYLSICLSVCLSICKLENEAILRDFLSCWTWQHQKRNNSARLPQFLHLTTSKSKQFCETSSFFKLTTSKTKQFCETSFKNGKLSAELTASYQCVLRFFDSICLNYCVCHERKKDLSGIISANLKIWCSKMQPLSGNQRPDLPTALMNMSLVLHLPRKMHLCRSSSNVPLLPSFLEMLQNPCVLLTFNTVHNPLRLPCKTTSERPKVPEPSVFSTFDFEMCFAPQRRALFRQRNFQKLSWPGVFCTFWLRSVLRATTACTFSTAQLPKVVRTWCALYILTLKRASRHNGVHFFDISTSKSGPNMVCFEHFDLEMCFAPQRRATFHLASSQMAPHPPL